MIIPSIAECEFEIPPTITQAQCREWIADLRSGKFEQGKVYLRRGRRYCCLGVYAETHGGIEGRRRRTRINADETPTLGSFGYGIDVECSLALANDDGATFPEIADWIERELLPRCAP